ncbi:hypothetical protein DE146DRAFT_676302 [Phaeosphaeria sp. MPI-PUGE-AT-0046c]|nr:hypothetical protein DE146DRAFT_676302 [Phaeosphaeria sp. MPI-PUGE-AT-0046c]
MRVLRSHTAAKAAAPPKVVKLKPKTRRRRLDPWATKRKPNPNPKPRAPPRINFPCRICVEEQPKNQFPKWFPISSRRRWSQSWDVPYDCIDHLAVRPRLRKSDPVCKTCIGRALSARLDQVGARQVGVGCIEPGCEVPWSWDYVMRYMPAGETLEKYNMEMFEVWRQDSTIKPMTCIAPDCEAVGLPDPSAPGYPQTSCNTCGYRSCSLCKVSWHKDLTCAEHAAKHVDEKMTDPEKDTLKLMQKKDGKRCPNCQLVIEKDGGCDSMFCIGCQKYFNWATAASAVPGAKKAEPVVANDPYWHRPPGEPVVCEMDALQRGPDPVAAAA